jgi:UDP-2,4-diacetamido-2,4,6-trideoxy-beta-L-altropyranose hydrolase
VSFDVAIRADASARIGSGHVARSLALAHALRAHGAGVLFLTRAFANGGFETIRAAGFDAVALPVRDGYEASWLGASLTDEIADVRRVLQPLRPLRGIVVDHYALDARWERAAREFTDRILAIDDLADRSHDCDFLLDANRLADGEAAYRTRVPEAARLLLGPRFALLRQEFTRAVPRARDGEVRRVFVFFGGVDAPDVTTRALDALARPAWNDVTLDVAVGAANPNAARLASRADARTRVHVATGAIAGLMERADLALGAGGTASWERAALGLPSLVVAIAPNQVELVRTIEKAGIAIDLGSAALRDTDVIARALDDIRDAPETLRDMSRRALALLGNRDGAGSVADALLQAVAV